MASNGLAAVRLLRPGNKAIGSWTGLVHAIPIALCATTVIQPARQLVTIGDCLLLRHCLPEAKRGFVLLPRRWGDSRSFGWMTHFRRLVPDDGALPAMVAGLHLVAFACLMLYQFTHYSLSP
jgi:transposase